MRFLATEPAKKTDLPWLTMQANVSTQFHKFSFNVDELFFLVDEDSGVYLQKLRLEEMGYRITIDMISEGSNIVLSRLQPKLEALDAMDFPNVDDLQSAIGPELVGKLSSLTDAILLFVEGNLASMEVLNSEFTNAMKVRFKGEYVLEVKYEKNA